MAALAMWFQDMSTGSPVSSTGSSVFTPGQVTALLWILGVIAFGMLVQALVYIVGGLVALKAMKEVKGGVDEVRRDIRSSTDEIKGKLYPLIDSVNHIGKSAEGILADATPKLKEISDHLVATTRIVHASAEKLGDTVGEANAKTQRQVARVDGMVTAALNTTADVVHAVEQGIKVPAQKIAIAVTEARFVAEGVLDKLKELAGGLPFMPRKAQKIPAAPGGYKPPVQRTATTPASVTGPVPLVK